MTWAPPANTDESDIDHYVVSVPSRNVMDMESFAIDILLLPNCHLGDIRIEVYTVNRFGCEGQAFELLPTLLDIPTVSSIATIATTKDELASTTEDDSESGSASSMFIVYTLPSLNVYEQVR